MLWGVILTFGDFGWVKCTHVDVRDLVGTDMGGFCGGGYLILPEC